MHTSVTRLGLPRLQHAIESIQREVGTPFYCYDWATLEHAVDHILSCAEQAGLKGRSRFYLAFFALPNLHIFRKLLALDERIGIACNTVEEILALKVEGISCWNRVVFSGGVISEGDLITVSETGCLVNAASLGNLDKLLRSEITDKIGIRIDPSDSALKGIRRSEINDCFKRRNRLDHGITAIHGYPGTEIRNCDQLVSHAAALIRQAAEHPKIIEINFGGGFWYDYNDASGDLRGMSDFDHYFSEVKGLIDRYLPGADTMLGWEPGRIVFAGAGFFISKVLEVRETGFETVDAYVDASFTQIPSPKIRDRPHMVVVLTSDGRIKNEAAVQARICGATTLSTDQLLPGSSSIARPEPNDLIVILDVGAYGRAGSYHFLGKAKPPEILLQDDAWHLIRRRERLDHLAGQ